MAPIILDINNAILTNNIAAFDYDWTLVCPKEGRTFSIDVNDWQWMYPSIPNKLKQLHEDGFTIIVFTNQSKSWKCDQIKLVCTSLNIPMFIAIAIDKSDYKPNTLMFDLILGDRVINKIESFYIGDALGRKTDFADSDKVFAENIGIKCIAPEQFFDNSVEFTIPKIPLDDREILIMVGYPGSGKTTIAKSIPYIHIEGDIYKTSAKMIKKAAEFVPQSIIFDATNGSIKKRAEYIEFAKKHNYKIKCIYVRTSMDESYKRNKLRSEDKQVPKIAYSVYKKHFDEPSEEEGFILLYTN